MPNVHSFLESFGYQKVHSTLYKKNTTLIILTQKRAYVWPDAFPKPLQFPLYEYIDSIKK